MCNKNTVLKKPGFLAPIQPIGSWRGWVWVWLKLAADHHSHHHRGLKMGSNAKYSPIVTLAHADVTNLTLILDCAPILTPWFELLLLHFWPPHLIRFWLDFSGLLSYFVIQSRRCLQFWTDGCKIFFPGCYARASEPRANHVR